MAKYPAQMGSVIKRLKNKSKITSLLIDLKAEEPLCASLFDSGVEPSPSLLPSGSPTPDPSQSVSPIPSVSPSVSTSPIPSPSSSSSPAPSTSASPSASPTATSSASPTSSTNSSNIGTNLAFANESGRIVFKDIGKQRGESVEYAGCRWTGDVTQWGACPWNLATVTIPRRADGYPLQVPFADPASPSGPEYQIKYDNTPDGGLPLGAYTFMASGTGQIRLSGAVPTTLINVSGTVTQTISINSSAGVNTTIVSSNASDPIHDIRLYLPGFSPTDELTQPFYPPYLDVLSPGGRPFKALRFMDWGRTNSSPVQTWSQRTTLNYATQNRKEGVAIEYMVMMSNILNADLWINIPHQADDNYVAQLGALLESTLNSNLKVYVEYSNELWNNHPDFSQILYTQAQGLALGLDSNADIAARKFQARRSGRIFQILEGILGDARLINVLAGFVADWTRNGLMLSDLNNLLINPTGVLAERLAIAPYFGYQAQATDAMLTAGDFLNILQNRVYIHSQVLTQYNRTVANAHGVGLDAYEGGQHLTLAPPAFNLTALQNTLLSLSYNPEMFGIYQEFFTVWKNAGGELFMNFTDVAPDNLWGYFGSKQRTEQPVSETPKYCSVVKEHLGQVGQEYQNHPCAAFFQ